MKRRREKRKGRRKERARQQERRMEELGHFDPRTTQRVNSTTTFSSLIISFLLLSCSVIRDRLSAGEAPTLRSGTK